MSEWQKKGYIKKVIRGHYIFSDLELKENVLFEIDLKQIESFYPESVHVFKRNILREYLLYKILDFDNFNIVKSEFEKESKRILLDKLNEEIIKCTKCRLSETRIHALCGEGNLNAKLFLIAQAPGENEDREGRMFIGPSGKVLDELFETIGMDRKNVYMTNLIKCMLPKYRKPKQDEIEICSQYLIREIELVDPEVLVPLGYYASRYIFEKYKLPMIARLEFNEVCGKLYLAGHRKIFSLQHPAVLLYRPSFREEVIKNYRKLNVISKECKWYPACPMKRFYEEGGLSGEWIDRYCKGDWESCVRYQMEEAGEYHPDWMLPDGTLDERLRK